MERKLSIKDLDLNHQKALIRVDFNVPLEHGSIKDDTRIRAALPTIQYALDQGAAVILLSHLGRPEGFKVAKDSLAPCARRLEELLGRPVKMAHDCIGSEVEEMVKKLKPGQVLLLENLRFHKGEEHPNQEPHFAEALARLGDLYIDDAFGCAHRAHASIVNLAHFFPGKAAMGFLMEKEIKYLGNKLKDPARPFIAILGGAKISTKFKVIQALMKQADVLLIGGAMAYTFFAAQHIPMGSSLVEKDFIQVAQEILEIGSQSRCRLVLPIDLVVTQQIKPHADFQVIQVRDGISQGWEGVDIGPKTIHLYQQELQQAKTVFWNGPLGVFECPPFNKGTQAIAETLSQLSSATTIVGGGDSVAAIEAAGLSDRMSHLSTGGGASLEYIEFGKLPGVEALSPKSTSSLVNKS